MKALLVDLDRNIEIVLVREVTIVERLATLVQRQDLAILVQQSPVLVLEERKVLNCLEVYQHQVVAQEDSVVNQLSVVTKDVMTPTRWIHNAGQVYLLLPHDVVDVIAICFSATELDPHTVSLSEGNLAYSKVLYILKVLFSVKAFARIDSTFVHVSVVVLLLKCIDHVCGTDLKRISVLVL